MGYSLKTATSLLDTRLIDAAMGDVDAYIDLGVAYSCGTGGLDIDLIEAHKWFNLAAVCGDERGQQMRGEVADEMTAREIAEAQRQARAFLASQMRQAA